MARFLRSTPAWLPMSMSIPLALTLVLSAAPPASDRVRALVQGEGALPSLRETLARRPGNELTELVQSALRRARWRGALPVIRGRFGTDVDLDVRDASQRVVTETRALGGSVQATFDLTQLLFDDREVALIRQMDLSRARRRRRHQRLVDLYMRRVRLELEIEGQGRTPERSLLAAELDARLEVLSDGAYDARGASDRSSISSSAAVGPSAPRPLRGSSGSEP